MTKTCGNCGNPCGRENCGFWEPNNEVLEQRFQQLAEVARDMLICVNDPLDFAERTGEKYMRNGHYEWSSIFRERLEELGVEL